MRIHFHPLKCLNPLSVWLSSIPACPARNTDKGAMPKETKQPRNPVELRGINLEPPTRFERVTCGLQNRCSTTEPRRRLLCPVFCKFLMVQTVKLLSITFFHHRSDPRFTFSHPHRHSQTPNHIFRNTAYMNHDLGDTIRRRDFLPFFVGASFRRKHSCQREKEQRRYRRNVKMQSEITLLPFPIINIFTRLYSNDGRYYLGRK